jgi:hypothetical protein
MKPARPDQVSDGCWVGWVVRGEQGRALSCTVARYQDVAVTPLSNVVNAASAVKLSRWILEGIRFEYHWWMPLVPAAFIALSLVSSGIKSYLRQHPKVSFALRMSLASIVIITGLGYAFGRLPEGSYEFCTDQPKNCIRYVFDRMKSEHPIPRPNISFR